MYTLGTNPANLWLWTPDMGFVWTSAGAYSWLWYCQGGTWLFYLKGSQSPRWFYNSNAQRWEKHNP